MKIDAIILAGGLGTRLKTVVSDRPKPLALINDKPFLDLLLHQLSQFKKINKVVLAVSHLAEKVISYYENKTYPFNIEFSIETIALGTGGAILQAIKQSQSKEVLILNGDSFVDVNLEDLLQFHLDKKSVFTLTLVPTEDSHRFGLVEVDSNTHKVLAFNEKINKKGGLINAGVYLISRGIIDNFPDFFPLSLERDVLPELIKNGVYGFTSKGKFIDIGTPEAYYLAQTLLKQNMDRV